MNDDKDEITSSGRKYRVEVELSDSWGGLFGYCREIIFTDQDTGEQVVLVNVASIKQRKKGVNDE